MDSRRVVASIVICSLLPLSACTTMRTIHPTATPGQPTFGPVMAGDTVIVETASGERRRFVVQQIDGDTIIAPGGQRYNRSEIVRLQRKSFSGPKTAGVIAGVVGGVILLIGIAIASAYGDLLGGGS